MLDAVLIFITLCNTGLLIFLTSRAVQNDFQREDDMVINAADDVRNSQQNIKDAISKLPKGVK